MVKNSNQIGSVQVLPSIFFWSFSFLMAVIFLMHPDIIASAEAAGLSNRNLDIDPEDLRTGTDITFEHSFGGAHLGDATWLTATMDVRVVDHLRWADPEQDLENLPANQVIENVPLGVGLFATLTNVMGNAVTVAMEVFNATDKPNAFPRLTQDGYLFKLMLIAELTEAKISSPDARRSLTSFLETCHLPQIRSGELTLKELESQTDIWGYLLNTAGGNTIGSFNLYNDDADKRQSFPCTISGEASDRLAEIIDDETAFAQSALATAAFGFIGKNFDDENSLTARQLSAVYDRQLVSAYIYFNKAGREDFVAADGALVQGALQRSRLLFRNQMLNNHIKSLALAHSEIDPSAISAVATSTQAALNSQQNLFWALNIKAIVQCVYFGLSPLVLLLLLTPVGSVILRNFVLGMFWIESWAPLMVILNSILSQKARSDIEAKSAYLSDTLGAEINHITISTQEQIRQIALETVQFGNVIAIILPFIFLGLLLGIGRVAGSVTSTVFRGDRPVYEGETPTSYNR